jgi:drug/metabolite transporter (DMT)-like permease
VATPDGLKTTTDLTRSQIIGIAMYLVAAFLFAFNGVLAKTAIEAGLSPLNLTQLRNGGAMVVLIAAVLLTNPRAFRVTRKELPFLIVYGVLAFTVVQFLYFFTISRLPVGIGTLLIFLAPVLVAVWIRFGRKSEVSNRIWIGVALALIGLGLVSQAWQGIAFDTLGVLAGLVTAVALALYWILGESGQQKRDALSLTMWGFIFATITWSVISPWWNYPWDVLGRTAAPMLNGWPGLPVWLIMLWGVVAGTVIPFLLVLGSLRRIGAQRAGLVGTTEPLWAAIIALLLLGEVLTPIQAIGGLVVLGGILIAETSRKNAHVTPGEFPQIDE